MTGMWLLGKRFDLAVCANIIAPVFAVCLRVRPAVRTVMVQAGEMSATPERY
jgi:hypothetical protein